MSAGDGKSNETAIVLGDVSDRKRKNHEGDGQQEHGSQRPRLASITKSCPIKLFATRQDVSLRKKNKAEDKRKTHPSWTQCWTLREMIGVGKYQGNDDHDTIEWIFISNYLIDFEFLLRELPELLSIPTAVVIYGSKDNSEEPWKASSSPNAVIDVCCRDPSRPPFTPKNPLKMQLDFGVHHTKLFLVGYASGRLRLIVHTANLRYNDIHLKTQGAYIEDFWPKKALPSIPVAPSEFEATLISYLKTYHYFKQHTWSKVLGGNSCTLVDLLGLYDFSTARGALIPSTPGFHKPHEFQNLGYLKLGQAIVQNTTSPLHLKGRAKHTNAALRWPKPIVCQYSSIGSLSKNYLYNLEASWDIGQAHTNSKNKVSNTCNMCANASKPHSLKLVYPTRDEICRSVEETMGGSSVPGRKNNVNKPFLKQLYHKWSPSSSQLSSINQFQQDSYSSSDSENDMSEPTDADDDPLNKAKNVPHIKTYYQPTQDDKSMEWFVLSSHNLSKGMCKTFPSNFIWDVLRGFFVLTYAEY